MKRVLVIEDETPIRENLKRFLRLEGYEAVTAENGAIGLRAAREYRPDLILCDVMMPEMTGFEVLAALREEADLAAIPIVFLTASAEKEAIEKGLDLGARAYVTKPFDLIDLTKKIRHWLDDGLEGQA